MKKNILYYIIILYSILLPINIFSQVDSCYAGVYISYDDYQNNKITYKVNLSYKKNNLEFVPLSKTIKISTKDSCIRFKPGTIYGFYKCGSTYRYSPNEELLSPEDYYRILEMSILESDKMIIYSSVFLGGIELFYSIGLSSKIHRLNVSNIEKDFDKKSPDFVVEAKKIASTINGFAKKDENGNYLIINFYEKFVKN